MHPSISLAMGKLDSLTLVWQLVWKKEISEFKSVKFFLKLTLSHTLLV